MSSAGSVSHWISQLKARDPVAAQKVWERYFARLVNLARNRLRGQPRRAADEEDVALSAFDSFCRGAEQGRFPRLEDRGQFLVVIAARKALKLIEHEGRLKRGGGKVLDEAALTSPDPAAAQARLEHILGSEPTPALAAQVAEECQRLLTLLPEADLRAVALAKMEGYSTDEIAAQFACAPRTIQRKLLRIRSLWAREEPP